jgi:hypothetical protein
MFQLEPSRIGINIVNAYLCNRATPVYRSAKSLRAAMDYFRA